MRSIVSLKHAPFLRPDTSTFYTRCWNNKSPLPPSPWIAPSLTNCSPRLAPSLTQVLEREMRTDETLYDAILNGAVPTVDTIYRFMTYLKVGAPGYGLFRPLPGTLTPVSPPRLPPTKDRAGYSVECNIIALIYLNRITLTPSAAAPTAQSWRALWATAVIVAQKMCESSRIQAPTWPYLVLI